MPCLTNIAVCFIFDHRKLALSGIKMFVFKLISMMSVLFLYFGPVDSGNRLQELLHSLFDGASVEERGRE